ncbi:FAD binding domain-containing protein [Dictyobacter aurantiacus]|nr:FAD binding domain-containing protein [Dictyobacter aurantiacus]
MWQTYLQPVQLEDALDLIWEHRDRARIIAGGTDVLVELQRGVKPTTTLIDVSKLRELKYVREEHDEIVLGALATHNDVIMSELCRRYALPLAQACWEVGAPPIRTRATIAGNLVTASPANDTIAPLLALNARVILTNPYGERSVPLEQFYTGVRRTILQPGEMLREIRFPRMSEQQRGLFIKLGLRRAQAISVINLALLLTLGDEERVDEAQITLGCLAPTIIHARTSEAFLAGKQLTPELCREAARLAAHDASPIDDVRSSATYRLRTLSTLLEDGLRRLATPQEPASWMRSPVSLETPWNNEGRVAPLVERIETTVNGQAHQWSGAHQKTLLNVLREDAGLTGTKEGCAEGECGACTVWLNGQAVMSCLVPAAQAHGAEVTTIEGLSSDEAHLHPLQQAFIDHAAVQCGYCIPGMLMSGARLLAEYPQPSMEQIRAALSGNICRCTGYRKIWEAVQSVGEQQGGTLV